MREELYAFLRIILEKGGTVLLNELSRTIYESFIENGGLDYVDYVFDQYYNCNIQINEEGLMFLFRYENAKYLS